MQVLHYVNGQKYEPHHDYFHDTVNPQKSNGGQRVATMLMYLTTVEEGGETVFPNSAEKVEGEQWSECARRGLAVKTQKGDALLFFRWVSHLHGHCHLLSRLRKGLHSSSSGGSCFICTVQHSLLRLRREKNSFSSGVCLTSVCQCEAWPVEAQKGDAHLFLRCVSHLYVL